MEAARARAQVSRADEQRVAALVGYTHLTAPYDGVVVVRNANTGDYVQPGTGDESGTRRASGRSAARRPLYVVARTDKVRVFVDVPEMDAGAVTRGTKAQVRVQALNDAEIEATVTRTSWSLRPESRTLRAEIDLPNPDARLLPGMYAYARVLIERKDVRALPLAAVVEIGNQNCCYLYEDGKAVQTPVQTGINDGKWVEVVKKRVKGEWTDFTGERGRRAGRPVGVDRRAGGAGAQGAGEQVETGVEITPRRRGSGRLAPRVGARLAERVGHFPWPVRLLRLLAGKRYRRRCLLAGRLRHLAGARQDRRLDRQRRRLRQGAQRRLAHRPEQAELVAVVVDDGAEVAHARLVQGLLGQQRLEGVVLSRRVASPNAALRSFSHIVSAWRTASWALTNSRSRARTILPAAVTSAATSACTSVTCRLASLYWKRVARAENRLPRPAFFSSQLAWTMKSLRKP